MKSADAAIERLCDPASQVSAHYVIDRNGQISRLVREEHRAWHAGAGEWRGKDDINSRSVGIELDNDGHSPFAASLMDALVSLLQEIVERWSIPPQNVIGHADMAPGRKTDPGPRFDWARLQRHGLAPRLEPIALSSLLHTPASEEESVHLLTQIGYTASAPVSPILQAFRDRFLPVSAGATNAADIAVMQQYLRDYGVPSLC